jgi:hypothetical protein
MRSARVLLSYAVYAKDHVVRFDIEEQIGVALLQQLSHRTELVLTLYFVERREGSCRERLVKMNVYNAS